MKIVILSNTDQTSNRIFKLLCLSGDFEIRGVGFTTTLTTKTTYLSGILDIFKKAGFAYFCYACCGWSDENVIAYGASSDKWVVEAQAGGAGTLPDEIVAYSACSLLVPMASDPVTIAAPNDYVNCAANL